jgi:hypothetical protein
MRCSKWLISLNSIAMKTNKICIYISVACCFCDNNNNIISSIKISIGSAVSSSSFEDLLLKLCIDIRIVFVIFRTSWLFYTHPHPQVYISECDRLTLMIDQQWPIDSIVNLLNLQTICLNFQCWCYFAVSLDVELDALFKWAWNLLSIRLMCNNSETVKLITHNVICLK